MSYGTVQAEKMTTESGYSLGAGNASSFKNRIINGGMTIDQRNNGAVVTPTPGSYTLDRWQFQLSSPSRFSVQRSTSAPTGFSNSLVVTSLGTYSVISSDFFTAQYNIEGFNFADFNWGSANSKEITLSFWVQSSLTGTFTGSFRNSANTRAYPYAYTINAANTWQFITITVPGDTTGSWVGATNGTGVQIFFDFGSGSANQGTPGAWVNGAANAATGQTNLLATNGATWRITGVQLEVGTVATSFDFRSIGTELALCQRYGLRVEQQGNTGDTCSTSTNTNVRFTFPVTMRSAPTASIITAGSWIVGNGFSANYTASSVSISSQNLSASAGRVGLNGFPAFGGNFFVSGSDAVGTAVMFMSAEL